MFEKIDLSALRSQLIERFYRYVAVSSQSDAKATRLPSTEGQMTLARLLADELRGLGLENVVADEHAIVTAYKPGTVKGVPKVGFLAHLDTVDVGLSPDIRPQLLHFDGQDLCLNAQLNLWLHVAEHPELASYVGQDILLSDGTSVLGADDKAAISIIMTMLATLNGPHGDVYVAFVPDEEIGLRGIKAMDLRRFPVNFAYTIDCCELGELVYQTFNAAAARVEITGVTAHPMSAKDVLVNPIRVATDFMARFDRHDTPEHTDGLEGYFWFQDMRADQNTATLDMVIRDFDLENFLRRKQRIEQEIETLRVQYPRAQINLTLTDTYANIANAIGNDRLPIDLVFQAMEMAGVTPKVLDMRGGTDGSALSEKGILTPNYFTGAHNFHSRFEFLPIRSFELSYRVTCHLVELVAGLPVE